MRLGLRSRLLFWLVGTVVPILAIGILSTSIVESRLADRVETELTNILRLEAARIERELTSLAAHSEDLASGPHVIDFVGAVDAESRGEGPEIAGGIDGFDAFDPADPQPLDQLANALVDKASDGNSVALAVQLLDSEGTVIGASTAADLVPEPEEATAFASAYRSTTGDERLPIVTPILDADGATVGSLAIDFDLSPITDLLVTHEGFGETSEAHIAQPTSDGDAAFITLLRFERDAAFSKVVPGTKDVPIVQSLSAPEPTVVHSPDYRAEPSVLAFQTIEATGWGLVVKIDQAEAFGVTAAIRTILVYSSGLIVISVLAGWALLWRPLVRRIRSAAAAAESIAGGQYDEPIDDRGTDEIAEMANSIDRLARDLDADIRRRTEVEAELVHRASHDQLTGIANRLHAEQVLAESLDDGQLSLLFIDLDGFKQVNDTWGHGIGDEILVEVGARLVDGSPSAATVARWGGDEFVVVLPDYDEREAQAVLRSIRTTFASPFRTSVGDRDMRASIGVATSGATSTVDELLHLADGRMFAEKEEDRRSRIISAETARLVEAALAEDRVEAWMQPIMSLADTAAPRIVGAESLVRIRTVDGLVIEPSQFLDELQHSRFGRLIDLRMAELTFATFAAWRVTGRIDDDFRVAINLSPASLVHPRLAERLCDLLRRYDMAAERVTLELSESLAELNQSVMGELRREGFVIAVDDFGLKHSNLDRLVTSGAEIAKIDRRWSDDDDVLAGLVRTCTAKGVTLIAEGVETAEQAAGMRDHGIHQVQGFHFGRPQPAELFEKLLERQVETAT